jgi:hypothetical protein
MFVEYFLATYAIKNKKGIPASGISNCPGTVSLCVKNQYPRSSKIQIKKISLVIKRRECPERLAYS